jgi:integrator complex subunit 2
MKEQSLHQGAGLRPLVMLSSKNVTIEMATTILHDLHSKPSKAFLVLSYLDSLSPSYLVPFSSLITSTLPLLLDASAGKRLKLLYSSLWMKLNSIIPRRLWVESINSLRPCDLKTHPLYTHHNLVEDPIIILRCDQRIFRCPMLLEITLKILAGYVSASRVWLSEKAHALNCMTSATPESGLHLSNQERDELRIALTAAQESSIIQLLLEICLPTSEDRKESSLLGPQLTNLREIQCLICSYLHQVFISEPSMVKLVHFQGYPLQLLPLMVTGIPSIHIVVDFLMELLSQTQLEKQVFAIQLTAHVTHQYPIPESLSILKDIFKKVHSFIEDIPTKSYHSFFVPILPALVKFCQSFPPLTTEVVEILVHICQVCSVVDDLSRGQVLPVDAVSIMKMFSMNGGATSSHDMNKSTDPVLAMEDELEYLKKSNLIDCVKWTFKEIMNTVLLKVSGKT